MSEFGALCDIKTPDFSFADERGTICQLLHGGFRQVNVVFTKRGAQRGRFHYHKINEELFYIISGRIRVTLRLGDQSEERVFGTGDMFQIHKEVRHDFVFLEDTLLVGCYDRGVELRKGEKDIYIDA